MSNPLNNWEIKDTKLFRKYEFDTFMDAIDFINQVAEIADAMDEIGQLEKSLFKRIRKENL